MSMPELQLLDSVLDPACVTHGSDAGTRLAAAVFSALEHAQQPAHYAALEALVRDAPPPSMLRAAVETACRMPPAPGEADESAPQPGSNKRCMQLLGALLELQSLQGAHASPAAHRCASQLVQVLAWDEQGRTHASHVEGLLCPNSSSDLFLAGVAFVAKASSTFLSPPGTDAGEKAAVRLRKLHRLLFDAVYGGALAVGGPDETTESRMRRLTAAVNLRPFSSDAVAALAEAMSAAARGDWTEVRVREGCLVSPPGNTARLPK